MSDVGDYWRDSKRDKMFFKNNGHWPDQKNCISCGNPFHPREKKHTRCQHCVQAWSAGFALVRKEPRHE